MKQILFLLFFCLITAIVWAATGPLQEKIEMNPLGRGSITGELEPYDLDLMRDSLGLDGMHDAGAAVYFLKADEIEANDELAMSTLLTIAVAAETFTTENGGKYPESIEDLTEGDDPFLDQKYCGETTAGFIYECNFSPEHYTLLAKPVVRRRTGTATFIVTTK